MTTESLTEIARKLALTATEVDRASTPPTAQMEVLADAGYFLETATASAAQRRRWLDLISSGCGATAFLASQHEASCRRLHQSEHRLFKDASRGKVWVGICFAHLRRQPSPVSVLVEGERLLYHGVGPWFSGIGLMAKVLLAGATETGEFLMSLTDLQAPGLTLGSPAPLAVMNATATAPLVLDSLEIHHDNLVHKSDAVQMNQADMHATVMQSARSLGVARACARYLSETAAQDLLSRLEVMHQSMDAWELDPNWSESTQLRLSALRLAGDAVLAALVSVGGRAHSLDHPVQRLARESAFYVTTQTTVELRNAVLAESRTCRRSCSQ